MFGTDDVIYTPKDGILTFDDVYHWKRYKMSIHDFGVRLRPGAFEEISGKVKASLSLLESSPRFTDIYHQVKQNSEIIIRDLTQITGQIQGRYLSRLDETVKGGDPNWWVQVSDLPAESFFEDDYEKAIVPTPDPTPHLTYGTVKLSQLDGLEVNLTEIENGETGKKEQPLCIDVPADGFTRWTIPPLEPLPLIREFCGVHGASALGRTVNITTQGKIPAEHQFCTPIGKLGDKLFVTLYFHIDYADEDPPVMGPIKQEYVFPLANLLEGSGFKLHSEGTMFRLYERDGDVVHLYSQLPGKEAEGSHTMPPFLLVARASEEYDPQHRSDLYEAIVHTMKAHLQR